jgi:hypothetical protein
MGAGVATITPVIPSLSTPLEVNCVEGPGCAVASESRLPPPKSLDYARDDGYEAMRRDPLTVIAIAIVAYALTNMIHEGLGHGGACLLIGAHVRELSSLHCECDASSKFVAAAGCIANVIAAAAGLLVLRRRTSWFWWLFTTINLLMPAGYLLFSGVLKVGDWVAVCRDLPQIVWRPALAIAGAALYVAAARYCARLLESLAGKDGAQRFNLIAYFTGGILYCVSGLFNPHGAILIAISAAAASFGGTSGLIWMVESMRGGGDVPIERSYGWMVGAAVVGIVFIAVLGPALRF